MKGIIGFENLRISCIIGVYAEERQKEQPIFVDLKIKLDLSKSIQTDSIQDTIDYVNLSKICLDLAKTHHFNLIETYARNVLTVIFQTYPVQWAWIKVRKPNALPHADHAFVELEEGVL